ncbi:23S rRNA pseudouridine1911/1915/1917 synthase [Paenibacillus endophyticus]|uniref:RNA pseudouridylate synthase n=1 Tax=Paenibacillus endophyticus TaxID=1294268 RepID=A0A7W5C621_9BACL|nr:RluA family pseudouridine synthase [Paenibacillus endophyticus]MBB3151761.1 23S rRNA pseudouridine1911/1915/1917 synthase [Paenibacillus endophyticus]
MPIHILFEDNQILAVVKPPGILSQEDDTGDPDMLTLLKQDLKDRYNKPGNVFLGLVHRLDRMVGGVMLFAKTSKAASRLSESVRNRDFGKTYVCVVQGTPSKSQARLTNYIRKDNKQNQVTVFNKPTMEAKEAILDYEVAAVSGRYSLIAVKLHTGRPHQIRAQLAHIGCPLVGDLKYGAKPTGGINQIALWSTSVSAPHPVSKEWMSFRSLPSGSDVWTWWTNPQLEAASSMLSRA